MAKNSYHKTVKISWTLILIALLGFAGGYLVASLKSKVEMTIVKSGIVSQEDTLSQMKERMNRVGMWGGKMMRMRDGVISALDEEIVLPNGTKISQLGKILSKDGKETMMKDGDSVLMNGTMMISR